MSTDIVYVNEDDEIIGHGPITFVVDSGFIKRTVHIFIFNTKGELLIQQRAFDTYAYPVRWDASASGHVDVGETYESAAYRELQEEIGIKNVTLKSVGKFYVVEHERDDVRKSFCTVYVGTCDDAGVINAHEVAATRWIAVDELKQWMQSEPEVFTPSVIETCTFLQNQDTLSS